MAESATSRPPAPGAGSARRTLLLIAAVVLAPVLAAYAIYTFFPRASRANYGTLLVTASAPDIRGTRDDGTAFRLVDLRGRWVLLTTSRDGCDAACERGLYATRQARTMQGRERERVVRALVVVEGPGPGAALLATHPDLIVVRAAEAAPGLLPGGPGSTCLVDPIGNLVLFYPEDPDTRGIANDLTRLLSVSRIG